MSKIPSTYYSVLSMYETVSTPMIKLKVEVVHAFNPSTQEAEPSRCCEFKASLVYRPRSRTAPPTVRIVHSGLACNIEEERYSERVYTIREGETLELTCLVTGHPRPQ
ncbi:hypothetical protein STEG23_035058, partial [Scotinomys teguina]